MGDFSKNLSHIGWDEVKRRQSERIPLVYEWIRFTGMEQGMSVLDIGTGPGVFTREYANAVGKQGLIYAIDKSAEALSYLLQDSQSQDNILTIHTDAELSLDSIGLVDIVMITDVLHHSDAPEAILKTAYHHLKQNGSVFIAEFDPLSKGQIGPPLQNRLYKDTIKTLSQSIGFRIVKEGQQAYEHYYILLQKL
jgi:ubiquinone/menaquinone biosynthesis C-methylase UbiE